MELDSPRPPVPDDRTEDALCKRRLMRAWPAVPKLDLLSSVLGEPDLERSCHFDPECCDCAKSWIENGWQCWHRKPVDPECCYCAKSWIENGWQCWHRKHVILPDEGEALTHWHSTTILRFAISIDFILGFQRKRFEMNVNELYFILISFAWQRIDFYYWLGTGQYWLGTHWHNKLHSIFTLRLVRMYSRKRQKGRVKTRGKKASGPRNIWITCYNCGERPWTVTYPNVHELTPRCRCGYW